MKLLRNLFFAFCALLWALGARAQFFSEEGAGKWQKLPFADIRLLSCTTGTLDRNLLVGGLQIKIHPDWILKRPTLEPLSKYGFLDYPIRPDPVDTTQYTGTILLPIVYIQEEKDLPFGVKGNLVGCKDGSCLEFSVHMALPLSQTESNYTPYCAYIMDEMTQTPKLDLNVGTGYYVNEHTAVLRFHVPNIHQAFLQNQNGFHFKVLRTQFWQNDVQFTVSYPEIWRDNTMQDWILITNQGVFRSPILLSKQPLSPILHVRSWGWFLLMGILLFICSPFFILLGIAFPRTNKQLRQQCIQAQVIASFLMLGACLIMKYLPYLNYESIRSYILVIMGITLIFPPRFAWWAGLLFIIWPKPYLREMLNDFSLWYLVPWLLVWQIIPFGILYRFAEFWGKKARWSLKKMPFSHCLFFLLPTIIMLAYGIYDARLNIPYQKEIYSGRPTLICQKSECDSWSKSGLDLQFINAKDLLGKTMLDFHQASKNLFIFDDEGVQTVLTDTTLQKFRKYLIGLKNYRAGYRPIHPPVHSGDDLHDLSPNAR